MTTMDLATITTDDMQVFAEAAMDQNGLYNLLSEIREVVLMKAEHIRTNWQDEPLALQWDHVATVLEDAEREVTRALP